MSAGDDLFDLPIKMLLFVTMLDEVAVVGFPNKEAMEIAVEDLEDVFDEVTFVLKLTLDLNLPLALGFLLLVLLLLTVSDILEIC